MVFSSWWLGGGGGVGGFLTVWLFQLFGVKALIYDGAAGRWQRG